MRHAFPPLPDSTAIFSKRLEFWDSHVWRAVLYSGPTATIGGVSGRQLSRSKRSEAALAWCVNPWLGRNAAPICDARGAGVWPAPVKSGEKLLAADDRHASLVRVSHKPRLSTKTDSSFGHLDQS